MNPDQDGFVGGTPVILLDQDFKMQSCAGRDPKSVDFRLNYSPCRISIQRMASASVTLPK